MRMNRSSGFPLHLGVLASFLTACFWGGNVLLRDGHVPAVHNAVEVLSLAWVTQLQISRWWDIPTYGLIVWLIVKIPPYLNALQDEPLCWSGITKVSAMFGYIFGALGCLLTMWQYGGLVALACGLSSSVTIAVVLWLGLTAVALPSALVQRLNSRLKRLPTRDLE